MLAAVILAGCGGSRPAHLLALHGSGFAFSAPAGWDAKYSAATSAASHDDQIVQVTTFPLLRPYTDGLFTRVKTELDARMQAVASREHGKVGASSVVTVAGGRAHSYELAIGGDTLQYTFVLRGKREFELLCRRPSSGGDDACKQLLASFRLV